jgi:acetyltransferase-like isoleucine patch superfamily enzyme
LISEKWAGPKLGFLHYDLNKKSKIADSAAVYDGARFRKGMLLVMEEDTFIGTNATILVSELHMGKGSQINAGAILTGKEPIHLGNNVVISYGAILLTASDTPKGKFMNDASPEKERSIIQGPITIYDDSFIGANSVIMPNVKIGPNSVVGAGCYIDKNVGPNMKLIPMGRYINLKRQNNE